MKPEQINEDEAVTRLLQSVMAQHSDTAPPAPGWGQVSTRLHGIRRRRQRRAALGLGAGLVVVGMLGAAALTDVLPSWHRPPPATENQAPVDPSVRWLLSSESGTRPSALADGRVRGSLAADRSWVQALRERAASGGPWSDLRGHAWTPPAPEAVSVLFAGDLGGRRLALVEGTWRSGPVSRRAQAWYEGGVGSVAADMTYDQPLTASDTPSYVVDAYPIRRGETVTKESTPGLAVALSNGPAEVRLEEPLTIDATGKVSRHFRRLTGTDSVYAVVVDTPGRYVLSVGADDVRRDFYGSVTDKGAYLTDLDRKPLNPPNAPNRDSIRGGTAPRTGALEGFAQLAWAVADQTLGTGEFRLLATSTTAGTRNVVGLLTLPSGARVVIGDEIDQNSDDYHALSTPAAQLLPAGDADDISIAWRHPPEFRAATDQDPEIRRPGRAVAMGPAGTTEIRWTYADGSTSTSATINSLGVNQRGDVSDVTYLGADGQVLGTAVVPEAIPVFGYKAYVQESEPPRTVHENWLLPPLAAARGH